MFLIFHLDFKETFGAIQIKWVIILILMTKKWVSNFANLLTQQLISLPAECLCDGAGVADGGCNPSGQCVCFPNYGGQKCDVCAPGYYGYPDCAGEWAWSLHVHHVTTIDKPVGSLVIWVLMEKNAAAGFTGLTVASSHDSEEQTSSFSHSILLNPLLSSTKIYLKHFTESWNVRYIWTSSF